MENVCELLTTYGLHKITELWFVMLFLILSTLNSFIWGKDSFANNSITNKGIEILANYLKGNRSIKILDISANLGIDDGCLPSLCSILTTTKVQNFEIVGTRVYSHALIRIITKFESGANSISFDGHPLSIDVAKSVSNIIKEKAIDTLQHIR